MNSLKKKGVVVFTLPDGVAKGYLEKLKTMEERVKLVGSEKFENFGTADEAKYQASFMKSSSMTVYAFERI